jgi:hypothetical protein
MKDRMISSNSSNVIIYEFYPRNNTCNLTCIQHSTKTQMSGFIKENLEEFFSMILEKMKDSKYTYLIKYDYKTKEYLSYIIPDFPMALYPVISEDKLEINNVNYVQTSKTFA